MAETRDYITILRSSDPASTTPIMSTGLEILAGAGAGAGHPKDLPLGAQFRPPAPGHALLDLNPAFRLPSSIPGLPGYPAPAPAPMVSSAGGGAPCRDPYCKDPSCPTFVYNAYLASARLRLPPGYLELLEAHKLASLGAVSAAGPASSPPAALPPSPSLPPTSLAASASLGPGKPRRRAVSAAADLTVPRRPLHLQLDGRARLLRQALQQRRGAPGPPQDPHQPLHLGPGGGGAGGGGGILRPAHPVADAGRGGQPAAAQRPLAAGGALIETNRRAIETL